MDKYLSVKKVNKHFGKFQALKDVNFDVQEGEFVCILGPSGCGKTTLLRVIAGLESQSEGEINQNNKNISQLPPDQRDFGIVFQSYALFPNLTVKNNISFGLKTRKQNKDVIDRRVDELLNLVGLSDHINKYSAQLSGGEQQRVALARALAPSPGLLLLDEPLSALDAKVRQHLRLEIKNLQRKLGVTTIMVTHDQEEALTMADRIILMNKGVIEQEGSPQDIYSKPTTAFSANFIGTTNLFKANKISSNSIEIHGSILECNDDIKDDVSTVTIRPEDVKISNSENNQNIFTGTVKELEFLGSNIRGHIEVNFKSQTDIVICNFASEYIQNHNIQKDTSINISLQPHAIKIVKD
ncbi:putative 2-aminoethylphosphonate ABC transporter ATP-binding protein [Alphaproteobacteria bacterium]|jgi:iron(III) transport system ATP-binding protein|nr:putative 2-aminoethylphosphonate ABC transporter ATP-binding protein [Marinovum sp.]MDB2635751.1 putative 2-aminoethylphosphonate ABC transporter ATP-binding protein [Alphaproteobacteria bacterium]MDC0967455.1 putative 2-aminoethylphosphonate ABC transporter ATP-binding protein [Alphaproteobacteria bacterium]OUX23463.1 MAG: phosphonate ABC transporter ATP-binding protein [Pelagibacteraceae bacterium TMED259]|tara:strand:+ start:77 stop:1138 length:1062 start_codon:yes stop_codon:yes gene_type:complete